MAEDIAIEGEVRVLLVIEAGSPVYTAFGAVSAEVVRVAQNPAGELTQLAGSAGAVTVSKFWLKPITGFPSTVL